MVNVSIENPNANLTRQDLLDMFLPDLEEFESKTLAFSRKEITVGEYKGFSGGFGSYAQRGGNVHMLRLRMTGARVTKERMAFIADTMNKYDLTRAKITTCQTIQLHDIKAEDLTGMMKSAWEAGMITRAGGGDFSRNIMISPLAGVERGEYMNLIAYAEAESAYVMQFIKSTKLPRKLKICFDTNGKNEVHATFRDLGFVARPDGTLDVYAAGGLGNNPLKGAKVGEKIDPSQIRFYIKAMVATFVEKGNYKNRGRARTRYMQHDLGTEEFKAAFAANLKESMKGDDITVSVTPYEVTKRGNGETVDDPRAIPQKQDGLYAVFYQPLGGMLSNDQIQTLWNTIKDMDQVEIRLTPEEGMYIINCNAAEAKKILEITKDGAETLFETSVACIGASTCQVGLRDSQGLLKKCVAALRKESFGYYVLPQIHISGCPSSCSAHQIGAIGFRGAAVKTAEGMQPAFAISVGGCAEAGKEVLAPSGTVILEDNIPLFLVELGKIISGQNSTYAEWIKTNESVLSDLIKKYAAK